jgi:hypothetical protein
MGIGLLGNIQGGANAIESGGCCVTFARGRRPFEKRSDLTQLLAKLSFRSQWSTVGSG